MALERGTRLGPYQIESPLGAGGMGEVYKATVPPESVIRYGTQIADALAHAHERGIRSSVQGI